jgi:hypothetical protein
LIQKTIGLDVPSKTMSDCVKDASGQIHEKGEVGVTGNDRRR